MNKSDGAQELDESLTEKPEGATVEANGGEQDYLDVTSQKEIGRLLLEQKKKALMAKYSL